MQGGSAWVVALVLAGVGFGAGYLVGDSGGEVAPYDDMDAPIEEGHPDVEVDHDDPMRASGPALEGTGTTNGVEALIASFPAPEVVRGDGTITGSVLDGRGKPVVGVKVYLTPSMKGMKFGSGVRSEDPEEQFRDQLQHMIKRHRWTTANRLETKTDAAGRYAFDGVRDAQHNVHAHLDGYQIRAKDRKQSRAAEPGAQIDFVAKAMARVRIEVEGMTPAPDRLNVQFRSSGHSTSRSVTPNNPELTLEPGMYEMSVTAGKHGEYRGGPMSVELTAGEPQVLKVAVQAKPVLKLTLVAPKGEDMGGQIFLLRVADGQLPRDSVIQARGKSYHLHAHRHFGGFHPGEGSRPSETIKDIEEGTYALALARNYGGQIIHRELIDVKSGIVEHDVQVPRLKEDEYVIVHVRSPKGEPLSRAQIMTGWYSESSSGSGSSRTVVREDGSILVMNYQHNIVDGDKKGTFWVEANVKGVGRKRVEYKPSQAREIVIQLEDPAALNLHVKGVKGSDYEGRVSVRVEQIVGNSKHRQWGQPTVVDAKGDAKIVGLQPGRYRVYLSLQGGQHHFSEVHHEEIRVGPGDNQATVTMPTLHSVTLRGGKGHVWISKEREKGSIHHFHQSRSADKEGLAVFDGLPAGTYTGHSSGKQVKFSLPGPNEVLLETPK